MNSCRELKIELKALKKELAPNHKTIEELQRMRYQYSHPMKNFTD